MENEKPIGVAVCAVIDNDKILLIKRIKEPYLGLWSLPGGKVEKDEHISEAAVREVKEETGINSKFSALEAVVSEHLVEDEKIAAHIMLYFCSLKLKNPGEEMEKNEGQIAWFNLKELDKFKSEIIPSDFLLVKKLAKGEDGKYYNCKIRKSGQNHELLLFEKLC